MRLLGSCNNSPDAVLNLLVDNNVISSDEVFIVPIGGKVPYKKSKKALFFLSVPDFLRNLSDLNKKDKIVVLFASPIRLFELTGITVLDADRDARSKGFGYTLTKLDKLKLLDCLKSKALPVLRDETKHLTILINSVKSGSLLAPLMTFIYSLPKASLQVPIKNAVATYFVSGGRLPKLLQKGGLSLSDKALGKLLDILNSEEGSTYRKAFEYFKTELDSDKKKLPKITKKFEVDLYEIRYLISVTDKIKP